MNVEEAGGKDGNGEQAPDFLLTISEGPRCWFYAQLLLILHDPPFILFFLILEMSVIEWFCRYLALICTALSVHF